MRASWGIVIAAVALAACQPLPRPFKPEGDRSGNPLLDLSDSGGVHVLDIEGAPDTVAAPLAVSMGKALLDLRVPASTTSANMRSLFLQGFAHPRSRGARGLQVDIVWDLIDPGGETVGRYAQTVLLPPKAWAAGDRSVLAAVSAGAAPRIAALVRDRGKPPAVVRETASATPPPPPRPAPRQAARPVHVAAVTGAPGDGNRALPGALRRALTRAGIGVAEKPSRGGLVIRGKVAMGRPHAGRQDITILWTVLDEAGEELGTLEQRNAVPQGSLDGSWGDTAAAVANAAAGGVADLLRRAEAAGRRSSGPG